MFLLLATLFVLDLCKYGLNKSFTYVQIPSLYKNRLDKMEIHSILSRTDSTDPLHKPGALIIAVYIYNIIHAVRECAKSCQLKVYKGHMVGEHHIGRLKPIHINTLNLMLGKQSGKEGKHPYKVKQKEQLQADRGRL